MYNVWLWCGRDGCSEWGNYHAKIAKRLTSYSKAAGANASQLTNLVSKYASLDQEIRDLERDKSGS